MTDTGQGGVSETPTRPPSPSDLVIRAWRPSDADELAELVNLPSFRFGTMRLPFRSPEEVRTWIEKTPPTSV